MLNADKESQILSAFRHADLFHAINDVSA